MANIQIKYNAFCGLLNDGNNFEVLLIIGHQKASLLTRSTNLQLIHSLGPNPATLASSSVIRESIEVIWQENIVVAILVAFLLNLKAHEWEIPSFKAPGR